MRKVTSISFAFGASESMTSKDAKPKSCVRFERHVEDRLIDRRNMLLGACGPGTARFARGTLRHLRTADHGSRHDEPRAR